MLVLVTVYVFYLDLTSQVLLRHLSPIQRWSNWFATAQYIGVVSIAVIVDLFLLHMCLHRRGRLVAMLVAAGWTGVALWLWIRQLRMLFFGSVWNVLVACIHVLMVRTRDG